MKKKFALALALALTLSLTACNNPKAEPEAEVNTPTETVTETTPVSPPVEPTPEQPEEAAPTESTSEQPEETPAVEVAPEEPVSTEPIEEPAPAEPVDLFTDTSETVYATQTVNIRSEPDANSEKVGQLNWSDSVLRTGVGFADTSGWSKVELADGSTAYISSKYLNTIKPEPKPITPPTQTPSKPVETPTQTPSQQTPSKPVENPVEQNKPVEQQKPVEQTKPVEAPVQQSPTEQLSSIEQQMMDEALENMGIDKDKMASDEEVRKNAEEKAAQAGGYVSDDGGIILPSHFFD